MILQSPDCGKGQKGHFSTNVSKGQKHHGRKLCDTWRRVCGNRWSGSLLMFVLTFCATCTFTLGTTCYEFLCVLGLWVGLVGSSHISHHIPTLSAHSRHYCQFDSLKYLNQNGGERCASVQEINVALFAVNQQFYMCHGHYAETNGNV